MPVNQTYVEQLVLEKLAGVISPEDDVILNEFLANEPEAQAIWQELNTTFSDTYLDTIRKDLDASMPIEEILISAEKEEKIQRKKRRLKLVFAPVGAVVVCVIGYFSFQSIWQQTVSTQIASTSDITLTIDDQQTLILDELPLHLSRSISAELLKEKNIHPLSANIILNNHSLKITSDSGMLSWKGGSANQMARIKTPAQKRLFLRLSDGTSILANAGTNITFPLAFNNSTREISIDGDAYLQVKKDAEHPFIVHLPQGNIKVLGTSFNVNTYTQGEEHVSLTHGKVNMLAGTDSVTLTPGMEGNYKQHQKLTTATFDATNILAGQTGLYDFTDFSLNDVMEVVAREYTIKVVFDNPAIRNIRVLAYLDVHAPLTSFIRDLKSTKACMFKFTGTGKDSTLHLY